MAKIATPQTGFGVRMQSAQDRNMQLEIQLAYRKLDLTSAGAGAQDMGLASFHLGGRIYPRLPQFGLGKNIGVRITGSALGGYTYDFADTTVSAGDSGNAGGLDISLSAGLAFSGRTDPSGFMAEIVYRPSTLSGARFSVQPSWALRLGFVFGPA